jgi:hypothetical protein
MRPKRILRKSRPVQVAAGAMMLAVPGSALALGAQPADSQSAPTPVQMRAHATHVAFGHTLAVTGTAGPAAAHHRLELQLEPAGSTRWHHLASGTVHRDGTFQLTAPLRKSGDVRVVPTPVQTAIGSAATTPTTVVPELAPSATTHVTVAAALRVPNRPIAAIGGRRPVIHGMLLPAVAGRRVVLLGRRGHGWHWLASARTGRRGRFALPVRSDGRAMPLRVAFAGDRLNSRVSRAAGRVATFTPYLASWYYDGGSTACGFHAGLGVANKGLPCGTHVTFSYGGRTVTAVVDDRGPYVGGRTWDLNQNTAAALGFGGVGTVWASY